MAGQLRGKVAVITGASEGIGYATAAALAGEGVRLVLGARRKEELETAAASLRRGGREARAVPCDVTIPQQVKRLVEAATGRWERVDLLVANAGIGHAGEFKDASRADMRQLFDVNVHGVLHCVQHVLPHMIAQGEGTIVIVSSVLGFRGVPRYAAYCATKAALNAFADGLRTELEPLGIHVVLACPGLTDTGFHRRRLGEAGRDASSEFAGGAQSAEEVGRAIVRAVKKRRNRIVLTRGGRLLARLGRHAPGLTDWLLSFWHRRDLRARSRAAASAEGEGETSAEPATAAVEAEAGRRAEADGGPRTEADGGPRTEADTGPRARAAAAGGSSASGETVPLGLDSRPTDSPRTD